MKFTTTLVVVLVVCVVAMEAARTKEEKMAARKAKKLARKEGKAVREGCTKGITYSPCDDATNKMNMTFETCKTSKAARTKQIDCTSTKTKTIGTCEMKTVYDYTACGVSSETPQNATMTISKSGDCTGLDKLEAKTVSVACNMAKKEFKNLKKSKKNKNKGAKMANKKARKQARKAAKKAENGAV